MLIGLAAHVTDSNLLIGRLLSSGTLSVCYHNNTSDCFARHFSLILSFSSKWQRLEGSSILCTNSANVGVRRKLPRTLFQHNLTLKWVSSRVKAPPPPLQQQVHLLLGLENYCFSKGNAKSLTLKQVTKKREVVISRILSRIYKEALKTSLWSSIWTVSNLSSLQVAFYAHIATIK